MRVRPALLRLLLCVYLAPFAAGAFHVHEFDRERRHTTPAGPHCRCGTASAAESAAPRLERRPHDHTRCPVCRFLLAIVQFVTARPAPPAPASRYRGTVLSLIPSRPTAFSHRPSARSPPERDSV